jgi:hypothetical protein
MRQQEFQQITTREFPELEARFRGVTAWWEGDDPGLHVLVGDVLTPFVIAVIESGDDTEIEHTLDFVERLANEDDPDLRNALTVSLLEGLGDSPDLLATARQRMGPKTLDLSRRVEGFWGREKPG